MVEVGGGVVLDVVDLDLVVFVRLEKLAVAIPVELQRQVGVCLGPRDAKRFGRQGAGRPARLGHGHRVEPQGACTLDDHVFAELQVEFPDKKAASLTECMDHQFQGEQIDDYQCSNCSPDPPKDSGLPKPKRHPAVIQRRIWKLPQNLILILKRFNPNGTKCHADFKCELSQNFSRWFADASPEISKKSDYVVQSIVNHHGSAGGGHYNAQVKSPETGDWNVYDDEGVGRYMDGKNPVFGPMNYILFFRKL